MQDLDHQQYGNCNDRHVKEVHGENYKNENSDSIEHTRN